MSIELGTLGAHLRHSEVTLRQAAEIERSGYGALWLTISPPADLTVAARILDATEHLVVGTAVVNIWTTDARTVAASYHRIAAEHPDRLILGIGAGHRETDPEYASPYDAMVAYLAELADAGVPSDRVVLAALGPRMLRLVRDRAAGTIPVLVTPEYIRRAREILGARPLVLPGQMVVLDSDVERGRTTGRAHAAAPALHVANYTANLRRIGFTDADLTEPGSDRLIDALVLHGDPATVAAGIRVSLEAGANHIGLTALGHDPIGTLRTIADAVFSAVPRN
ncbi:TIGR03620 family F420-dependent LLM class oxidoreductase [Nocardia sp. NPDC051911]|uniref:TIGR03620 family F420-dependent LLM class oxidoreductase n=1 Tax=Nocardia sp. NPDC051911 TaxID=3154648 RepID=UPI0034315368